MLNFIVDNFSLVLHTSQMNPQFALVHQNTERSYLVVIVNNSNYSEAKVHSSFVNLCHHWHGTWPHELVISVAQYNINIILSGPDD